MGPNHATFANKSLKHTRLGNQPLQYLHAKLKHTLDLGPNLGITYMPNLNFILNIGPNLIILIGEP